MSEDSQREDITSKRVVCRLPGMESVTVLRDLEYLKTDSGALTMDLYLPPSAKSGARVPAVVFVSGYSDIGFQRMLGCRLKDMGSYVSWAQLAAISGLAAITYSSTQPVTDIHALLQYVRQNAALLGIDAGRLGVWACSGNVPNALNVLMNVGGDYLKCAVLCYGYMLDTEGAANVADAAGKFGFANAVAGRSIEDIPRTLPLLIVRSGLDEPGLNGTIDRFLADALSRNMPVTFVNYHDAPHAFDILLDSETSREVVREILEFMKFYMIKAGA